LDIQLLISVFGSESSAMDAELRRHPMLAPLFTLDFTGCDLDQLRQAYVAFLKMHGDYVRYTVPALRAAGEALAGGDADDREWSAFLLGYATGETDTEQDTGHEAWIRDDIMALDPPASVLDAPAHPAAICYGQYFVGEAAHHPYAILGAKGVLEHLSIVAGDDLVRGVLASGIPNGDKAVRFAREHSSIDIDHVREGDQNLGRLAGAARRSQVLQGAYFTSGVYRTLVRELC
jgi:hypothetical protein